MLSTPSSPQRSPKRSPKRKVLHERSQSQANKILRRIVGEGEKEVSQLFTPYPTKPAHVLLPSTLRSQNETSGIPRPTFASRFAKGKEKVGLVQNHLVIPSTTNANPTGVKRSVSELRNLYESQATSRPSTSHSSRSSTPITSPALRGQYLGERLSEHGRFLPSEAEELLSLPPPRESSTSIRKIASEASLPLLPPSPQSPARFNGAAFNDSVPGGEEGPTTPSSPNLVILGSSSSVPDGPSTLTSSPNLVSLGHSSSQDFGSEKHEPDLDIAPLRLSSRSLLNSNTSSNANAVQSDEVTGESSESPATSSSPNVATPRSSSPNYVITKVDNSPTGSVESLRTIKKRRSETVHEQPSTSTFSVRSEQFNSSPPNRVTFEASTSTLDLPQVSESETRSDVLGQDGRLRAHERLQNAIESSPAPEIQYPIVSAPNWNTWEDLMVQKRIPRQSQEDIEATRWNPHLSTVLSEWSGENQAGSFHTVDTEISSDAYSIQEMPDAAFIRDQNIVPSTTSIIPEADRREASDVISDLRVPHLHHQVSGFLSVLSGSSRSNSLRSIVLRRPDSSGSLRSTVRFPGWARCYYSRGPSDPFYSLRPATSTSNFSQASLPSTPITVALQQSTHNSFRPRTRGHKNARESHLLPGIGPLVSNPSQHRLSSLPLHPADPRYHWASTEQSMIEAELHDRHRAGSHLASEWSPHLFPDHRTSGRNRWLAPSVDENGTPIFTWRDAHMLGFMLGFIFPISWFVAALLPLPPRPVMKEITRDLEAGPTLQEQLDRQMTMRDEVRYANLRWWRNLNRFMCIVGLVVIAIVVSGGNALRHCSSLTQITDYIGRH